jgi:hypothetical protein
MPLTFGLMMLIGLVLGPVHLALGLRMKGLLIGLMVLYVVRFIVV